MSAPYRIKPPNSQLGVHGVSLKILKDASYNYNELVLVHRDSARVSSKLTRHMIKMELSDSLIAEIIDKGKAEMLFLGEKECKENNIYEYSYSIWWTNDFWSQIGKAKALYEPYK